MLRRLAADARMFVLPGCELMARTGKNPQCAQLYSNTRPRAFLRAGCVFCVQIQLLAARVHQGTGDGHAALRQSTGRQTVFADGHGALAAVAKRDSLAAP